MNTRSCERVNGLSVVLRGYASMISELAGDQWNEAMFRAVLFVELQCQMLSMQLMVCSKLC